MCIALDDWGFCKKMHRRHSSGINKMCSVENFVSVSIILGFGSLRASTSSKKQLLLSMRT